MERDVELRWRMLVGIALNALVLGALLGLLAFPQARQRLLGPAAPTSQGTATVGGPFELVSQTGAVVTDRSFRGRVMLVAFGYSREPDLTPATLQTLALLLDRLGAQADRVAALFISLEPTHDTPDKLQKYLANFDSRLIGLTGTPEAVAAVAKAYRLPFASTVDSAAPRESTITYEPLIFLMNQKGDYVTHLSHDLTPDAILNAVKQVL